jgi:hypothetical protein
MFLVSVLMLAVDMNQFQDRTIEETPKLNLYVQFVFRWYIWRCACDLIIRCELGEVPLAQ